MHCKADIRNCLMDSLKVLVKAFHQLFKLIGDELYPNSPTLQVMFELEIICSAVDIMKGRSLLA